MSPQREPSTTSYGCRYQLLKPNSENGKREANKYLLIENQFWKLFVSCWARAYISQLGPQKLRQQNEAEENREKNQKNWNYANFLVINFLHKCKIHPGGFVAIELDGELN